MTIMFLLSGNSFTPSVSNLIFICDFEVLLMMVLVRAQKRGIEL